MANKSNKAFAEYLPKSIRFFLFAIKRTFMSLPYWISFPDTYRYFLAVRKDETLREPLTWFRLKNLFFGTRPFDWYTMEAIVINEGYAVIKTLFSNRSPEIIIDAGANIGLFSVYALSLWETAKLFAIEASPETYQILEKNQKKNPGHNFAAYHFALWSENGEINFENKGFSFGWHVTEEATDLKVPAIPLDSFIDQYLPANERISLLKMDIEGAEELVLLASRESLDRVDSLLIEVHSHTSRKDVVMGLLKEKFLYLYDISEAGSPHSIFLASNWQVPGDNIKLAI